MLTLLKSINTTVLAQNVQLVASDYRNRIDSSDHVLDVHLQTPNSSLTLCGFQVMDFSARSIMSYYSDIFRIDVPTKTKERNLSLRRIEVPYSWKHNYGVSRWSAMARYVEETLNPFVVTCGVSEESVEIFTDRFPKTNLCERCVEFATTSFLDKTHHVPAALATDFHEFVACSFSYRTDLKDLGLSDTELTYLYEPLPAKNRRSDLYRSVDSKGNNVQVTHVKLVHNHHHEHDPCTLILPLGDEIDGSYSIFSLYPLSIHSSIVCPTCKCHGYLSGGEWRELEPTRPIVRRMVNAEKRHRNY